ncbi:MAG: FixH family protein [Gammaproteobacteria bacterium]|jgi:hypothetical protein|nr:FixH family protein [Gammaproteobacteria bacterium]MBT3723812.1 FixH family protein [Gammaproteobacteria bacterium]MBT4078902.1 FixH family protein [Gammaproteobacteria bacterium]MBT4196394.1 FixH family protein [Gammaproteobacteria bacterium]MBT4448185.1 FixH family protein [Gammaproteobacteria bacterium]
MSKDIDLKNVPWFKNPMVWMVIFFPSLAVVAGTATIFIAINTEDGLVVDDYYKKGLQINQIIEYDKKSKEMGLRAFVDTNAKTGEILVSLEATTELELKSEITFRLVHRTRSGLDQFTTLSRVGNSPDYKGYIKPPIIEGRWTIQIISQGNWRLKQNFTTKDAENILMNITS